MICFYCAEEIRDDALVCRHCHRDVTLLRSAFERLAAVETRLEALELAVSVLNQGATVARSVPIGKQPDQLPLASGGYRIVIPGVVSVVLGALAYYAAFNTERAEVIGPVTFIIPLPFGLWAGLWARGRHLAMYTVVGSVAALFVFAINLAIHWFMPPAGIALPLSQLVAIGLMYTTSGALFFTTGALLGDEIEKRRFPVGPAGGVARTVARRLLAGTPQKGSEQAIRRLANLLSALAPLLTFIASLVTAYLTYQAGVAGKK